MPHVNNRREIEFTVSALGGPYHRHAAQIVNGRRPIDTDIIGQRDFQALLFRLFTSAPRSHPWDITGGRMFRALQCYFSWVLPTRDSLIIRTSTAGRVASYLVPFVAQGRSGEHLVAGIAGLRVESARFGSIVLRHLPTGGALILEDSSSLTRRSRTEVQDDLHFEVEVSRKIDLDRGRIPVFETNHLSKGERSAYEGEPPGSPLLSALMSRINLWWHEFHSRLTATPPYRSELSLGAIHWNVGLPVFELATILVDSPLMIPGIRFLPPQATGETWRVSLDSEYVDFLGPDSFPVPFPSAARPDPSATWRTTILHMRDQLRRYV